MATREQVCSTDGCGKEAAFTTRTKPAWCLVCLTDILAGLEMDAVAEFPGKTGRWLTRCRACGAECHYRLDYLLELRTRDEPACRRCFWTGWAAMANRMSGITDPVSANVLREHLHTNGFDAVEEIVGLPSDNHPVLTRCRICGRQEAQRPRDIAWGCTCTRNGPSSSPVAGKPRGGRTKNLLADSGDPALAWWDHDANTAAVLQTVTLRAHRTCLWACPDCGHKFSAKVYEMTKHPRCPACRSARDKERSADYERLKRTSVAEMPELLAAWDDEAAPSTVMVAGPRLRRFRCANGHHPRTTPYTYLKSGCQFCRTLSEAARQSRSTLAQVLPEIANQWHPTRNGTRWTPNNVGPNSKRVVWWLADCCGHEWQEPVVNRNKYKRQRCPECRTILDSLAWVDPGLASEWSNENPITAWHIRPTAQTVFSPKWVCSVDSKHHWQAPLASRSAGSECPECRQTGKSRVELDHLDAAKQVFTEARSGAAITDSAFATRKRWTVDILTQYGDTKIAIEYDGAYWHAPAPKLLVDRRKSLDLLAAGYRVVRLREDDLPSLDIADAGYLELRVHAVAPRPTQVMADIAAWLTATIEEARSTSLGAG